ncbi:MAG: CAP domain-containing protein [Bacteroidales bacterium]|nr:CAP domain-containing protein [Bacteroidales bacterium]
MNTKKLSQILFVLFIFISFNCKKDKDEDNSVQNNNTTLTAKEKIIKEYKEVYLASNVSDAGWTGDKNNCIAGNISAEAQSKTLQRINYFRKLVGLPGDIVFDTAKNKKCQQAALMFNANSAINHYPPNSWLCYTSDGAAAAGSSNIFSGRNCSNAVTGYIEDFGSSNIDCGHRRWILYPKMKIMGHGATNSTDCLWVIGGSASSYPKDMPDFVCYPPQNYVPAPLVFSRWSFSIPGASFASTQITMTDSNNNPVALNIISNTNTKYGENSIIWEPQGIVLNSSLDVTYNIKVSNVKIGSNNKEYSYKVIIVKI